MTADDDDDDLAPREDAWRLEQVDFLYKALPGALVASAIIALILAAVQWEVAAPAYPMIWLAAFGGATAARAALGLAYRRAPRDASQCAAWLRRFRIGVAAAGFCWGLGVYLLFPANDVPHQAFVAFAIAGVSAGAAITLAADRTSLAFLIGPALLMLMALFVVESGNIQLSMGAMTTLYGTFLTLNASRSLRWLRELTNLRTQAIDRADKLRLSKARQEEAGLELAENQRRLSLLLATTREGFWFIDNDARTTDVNPAMCAILGRRREDIVGKDIFAFVDEGNAEIFRAALEARRQGKVGAYQIALSRPDGTTVHCLSNATPIHDAEGERIGSVGTWADITDLVEAQAHVKVQNEIFEAMLEAIPDGVQVIDANRRSVADNDQLYELLGIDKDAARASPDPVHFMLLELARRGEYGPGEPETLARERLAAIGRRIAGEGPIRYERLFKHGRWIEARLLSIEGGRWLTLYRDVSETKLRERELARQSTLLETILANMGEGITVHDQELRLVAANDRFRDLTGVPAAVARPGAMLRDILVHQARAGEFGPCDPDFEADRRIRQLWPNAPFVYQRTRPNGHTIEFRRSPIAAGGFVTLFVDITERKEAERALTEKTRILEAMLKAMPDGVRVVDANDRSVIENNQLYELMGYDKEAARASANPMFFSMLEMARRGEYGPGDPEALARARVASVKRKLAEDGSYRYERLFKHGRWIEARLQTMEGGGWLSIYRDTTEARHREAELARQSTLLQTIFASMGEGITVFDQDLHLIAWNDRFLDLTGVPADVTRAGAALRDMLVGQAQAGEFGPSDPEAEADRDIRELWQSKPLVRERMRPNGRSYELRRNPIAGGGFITLYVDTTARRRAEDAVRELNATLAQRIEERTAALAASEERTRRIIDTALDAVVTMDGSGRITGWNPQAEAIFGWSAGETIGRTLSEIIIPPPLRLRHEQGFRRFVQTGESRILNRRLELTAVRRDGSEMPVELAVTALAIKGERQFSAFVRDITARKAAESELTAARMNLADAIESMRQGLVLYDQDDRVVVFNDSFVDHYRELADVIKVGIRFEDMFRAAVARGLIVVPSGREIDEFIAERTVLHRRADRAPMIRTLADGRVLQVLERRARNGGIIGTGTDVTEQLRTEQQLREVQRIEAVGKLTGGMAHDFNNYLAVIIGNLDLVEEDAAVDPATMKLVDAALSGALRAADLTRSLLAFARRQPLDPRQTDVSQRVAAVASLLERTLGEDIALTVDPAPDPWPVRIDGAQLDSCIVNLANNARDAMPHGGGLAIATRNVHLDAAYAKDNPDTAPGDYVLIEVSDTGAGMAPETVARAFEPFFTTKGPGHGTGLGLSMVYGFVRQSGGHIKIYSEAGHGTAVRIYLPRDHEAGAAAPSGAPGETALAGGGETILVVEDNDLMREAAVAQLTALGYRVVEAANGEAALAILDQHDPTVDLLFTDIVMPGKLDGYELALRALERRPGIKVLLTSGFPGDTLRRNGKHDPKLPLIGKPYRKDELARMLRAALESGTPGPQGPA